MAGDALLTLAFDVMARAEVHAEASVRAALVLELARAAGIGGMAGGQMLDLAAEGRFGDKPALGETEIDDLAGDEDRRAASALPARAGAILGQADAPGRAALDRYGAAVGQAFQIADDLLDVEGDAATLGKAAGKDAAAGKATLVSLLGVKGAHARLAALVAEAESALAPFGGKADILRAAARFIGRAETVSGAWPAAKPPSLAMPIRLVRLHVRLLLSIAIGVAVFFAALLADWRTPTRVLAGWDVGVGVYLAFVYWMMGHAAVDEIRRRAAMQDEGAFVLPLLTAAAAIASLVAVIGEIGKTDAAESWRPARARHGDDRFVLAVHAHDFRAALRARILRRAPRRPGRRPEISRQPVAGLLGLSLFLAS